MDCSAVVETPNGQKITLRDGPDAIHIEDRMGNSIAFEPMGITVHSPAKITINGGVVDLNAGMVNVNAPMAKFSGIVQCETLISNTVVSQSYTPGAGNVW